MRASFQPLGPAGKELLTAASGVEFRHVDMANWFCVSVEIDRMLAAVIACEPQNHFDWRCNVIVLNPRAITRKLLRVVFTTLFSRAARITALVEPDNEQALKQMERLGFKFEGFLRRGFDGRRDALVYGMLPEDCPWIADRKAVGRLVWAAPPRAEMH